jgi:hypothetical protein
MACGRAARAPHLVAQVHVRHHHAAGVAAAAVASTASGGLQLPQRLELVPLCLKHLCGARQACAREKIAHEVVDDLWPPHHLARRRLRLAGAVRLLAACRAAPAALRV